MKYAQKHIKDLITDAIAGKKHGVIDHIISCLHNGEVIWIYPQRAELLQNSVIYQNGMIVGMEDICFIKVKLKTPPVEPMTYKELRQYVRKGKL